MADQLTLATQADSGCEPAPDETTLCKFRHLLELHGLAQELFKAVNRPLHNRGLTLSQGTIVDATVLGAPSPAKNRDKVCDPEMHATETGSPRYFGSGACAALPPASVQSSA